MSGIIGQNIGRASGLKKVLPAGGNTPYFMARRGTTSCSGDACSQSTSDNSYTKAYFNQMQLDTDSCYDASNYRFTPNKAGKYYMFANCYIGEYTDRMNEFTCEFRINGAQYGKGMHKKYAGSEQSGGYDRDSHAHAYLDMIIDFNGSSDYIETWIKIDQSANYARLFGGTQSNHASYWGGFFIGT